jgi:hypothetical protein
VLLFVQRGHAADMDSSVRIRGKASASCRASGLASGPAKREAEDTPEEIVDAIVEKTDVERQQ